MYRSWVLLWLVVCACGDNIGLPRAADLVIVAHQDDDLLFMQPDVSDEVSRHDPVTIVYVTAGDAAAGLDYAKSRIVAAKAAYGWMAGRHDWSCAWLPVHGHLAQRCELTGAPLTLIFLGYPDGGVPGNVPSSLLHLWDGTIQTADTVAEQVATYDKDGLIATVAELIATTRPSVIRTLEVAATHGDDHADHLLVGALTLAAFARSGSDAALVSYRGYNINYDPANIPDAISDQASLGMRAYEACQTGCAACGELCERVDDPRYAAFLHRHYSVAMRPGPMSGLLQTDNQCVIVEADRVSLGDCARGTELELTRDGSIRAGARCFQVSADDAITATACERTPDRFFLLDEEGHLWSGLPAPAGIGRFADHTMCLVPDAGGVRAQVCGADLEKRWVLGRPPVVSRRDELEIAARGRSIRLADVTGDTFADLCRIERGGLWCAPGDGTGHFLRSIRIDAPEDPMAIDPDSLVLGDLDGDGQPDACGRNASGLRCATFASGYQAIPWSPAFARSAKPGAVSRVLAIVDGQVCGATQAGIACAAQGAAAVLRSGWPADATTVWPGDLDGDFTADWCAATAAGPACGLDADRAVTSAGAPWGFAMHAQVEGSSATDGSVADEVRGAMADVSGDGKADLCVALGGAVECALSQGHAFGPRFAVLTLAPGVQAQALWLGDLDGDGKADPCIDDGTSILCAISP